MWDDGVIYGEALNYFLHLISFEVKLYNNSVIYQEHKEEKMKKIFITLMMLSISAFAMNGQSIYKAKCSACHAMHGIMTQSEMSMMKKKMQNATPKERMAMRQKMQMKMKKAGMLAPAMPMVSMRLKKMTGSKEKFIAFVKDYIQNPSQDKGYCMPMAYKRFGTMPAIGKGMTAQEREIIANWLYSNFKGKWGMSMDTKMCEGRNGKKTMKCGGKKMKCGAGKCGAVKIQTH